MNKGCSKCIHAKLKRIGKNYEFKCDKTKEFLTTKFSKDCKYKSVKENM